MVGCNFLIKCDADFNFLCALVKLLLRLNNWKPVEKHKEGWCNTWISSAIKKIVDAGSSVSKVAHVKAILNGLTKEYDPLVITVTSKKVVFSIEEMDC